MTESPKLVNVEYVLFDMDGLFLINRFRFYFLTRTHVRSVDRLGEDSLDRNKYVYLVSLCEADMYKRPSIDDILSKYGKELTWDIKAGCMGKRKL